MQFKSQGYLKIETNSKFEIYQIKKVMIKEFLILEWESKNRNFCSKASFLLRCQQDTKYLICFQ